MSALLTCCPQYSRTMSLSSCQRHCFGIYKDEHGFKPTRCPHIVDKKQILVFLLASAPPATGGLSWHLGPKGDWMRTETVVKRIYN